MTTQDILKKAIDRAVQAGWQLHVNIPQKYIVIELINNHRIYWAVLLDNDGPAQAITESSIYGLIFNHGFAKALWGNDITLYRDHYSAWQYHLQQMVIAEEPVQYIGKVLAEQGL